MGVSYDTLVQETNTILDQYSENMTLRQIYYRLVSKHIIPNTRSAYKGLSQQLVKARENGEVDDYRIEDRTRTTMGGDSGYSSPEGFLAYRVRQLTENWNDFTLTMWENQPKRVEVWVEKDALAYVMSDSADEWSVMTCPSKGYSSYSYIREAVERINDYGKPTTILYFGDYDPSGKDIERDLYDRLVGYGCSDVELVRYALTRDQIDEYGLPPMMAKSSDPRFARWVAETGGRDAVELDALEPPVLKELVSNAIREFVDDGLWDEREEEIQDEVDDLRKKMEGAQVIWGDGTKTPTDDEMPDEDEEEDLDLEEDEE